MEIEKGDKVKRVLDIYTKLLKGDVVFKPREAANYGVNERSIQRDIDDIRDYIESAYVEDGITNTVIYDRAVNGYRLDKMYDLKLTNAEILAVCKILLESRAFTKDEMENVVSRLVTCCVPQTSQKSVKDLIGNELFHYVEPRHGAMLTEDLWKIGQAIQACRYIEIDYLRMKDKSIVKRKVKPLAIMFSEFYFYLTAVIEDDDLRRNFEVLEDVFPTIYRIDRIKALHVLDEKFYVPYSDRFEEGEFRKRIQFMYGGKLQRIKFLYEGPDLDAVLDRLPTAKILKEEEGVYTISAEVFGKGIDMWLRSQGDYVRVQEIK